MSGMWWIVPIGIAVGIKLIYDAATAGERAARQNWENKRQEVERTVEEHRANIERHLAEAQQSYDFHFLTDLHYSSHKVGDSAYQILRDARSSRDGISKMLLKAKDRKLILESELQNARQCRDRAKMQDAIEQIRLVNDLRRALFDDRNKVQAQVEAFLEEVRRLNAQTANLKCFIRDRCGEKGSDWYRRLEERKRQKRESGGK